MAAVDTSDNELARSFLGGRQLSFGEADGLWRRLREANEPSLARAVLANISQFGALADKLPARQSIRDELSRAEAELTSKDPELGMAVRHDDALEILGRRFDLDDPALDGESEVLGTAGGIFKRRWQDLGRIEDLRRSADLYERAASGGLGSDAYAQINAAFLDDLLASNGFDADRRRASAAGMRERILRELPADTASWWNIASRAEALLGLGRYIEATDVLRSADAGVCPAAWELQSTARQLGQLALLREPQPLEVPALKAFFTALLPDAPHAAISAVTGRLGLALSGGGFRASFFHLGVLARLAEVDVLRHLEVLSCVSGGSIVGAGYWLALRRWSIDGRLRSSADYVALVQEVVAQFRQSVTTDLIRQAQPGAAAAIWRMLKDDQRGAIDPEQVAAALEANFYQPAWSGPDAAPARQAALRMHDLPFVPKDHSAGPLGHEDFHPLRHNWLRAHKIPDLVINATTLNTGHGWQFTPRWMGESPWACHEAADSVPRLEWARYDSASGWQIELSRAVAASACVPLIFAPLELAQDYEGALRVQLVDGGVFDNQGTTALLAHNCGVLMVSDACGQLTLQERPPAGVTGLGGHALRAMDTLMARVRLANFADLEARRRSGLLRGLMFLHMKDGLSSPPIRRMSSQRIERLVRAPLSPAGMRKDMQRAIADLRTDLDVFTDEEANALMACGYLMAGHALRRDLAHLPGLVNTAPQVTSWPFDAMLSELTSTDEASTSRARLLAELAAGKSRR